LAREAAADEIDRREAGAADPAHVLEALRLREVAREDRPAVGIELDLPGDPHTGSLEAEVEAADSREEAADIHAPPLLVSSPSEVAKTSIQLAGS
jgi:hypothetical protein